MSPIKARESWKHLLFNPPFTRELKDRFRFIPNPFPLVGCPVPLKRNGAAHLQSGGGAARAKKALF